MVTSPDACNKSLRRFSVFLKRFLTDFEGWSQGLVSEKKNGKLFTAVQSLSAAIFEKLVLRADSLPPLED